MAGYDIATIGALGDMGKCSCEGGMGDATNEVAQLLNAGWLPTMVWPSDVDDYKRKLDPDFRATNAAAKACADLSAGERSAWDDFFRSWDEFSKKPTPTFGSANQYDATKAFESRLQAWQELLAKTCKLHAPGVTPEPVVDTSAIKWVAGAAIVIALAYVASPLILGARKVARR